MWGIVYVFRLLFYENICKVISVITAFFHRYPEVGIICIFNNFSVAFAV